MEVFVIFIFVIAPLSIILHEIGHALAAHWFKAELINLSIGLGRKMSTFSKGKFKMDLHIMYFTGGHLKHERSKEYSKIERILISFSGPILNMFLAIGAYYLPFLEYEIFNLMVWFNIWLAVINIVPFRIGERKSDGFVIVEVLFKGGA